MVRVCFWTEEGEAQSINMSLRVNQLLNGKARSSQKRTVDILREVLTLFGQVTEADLVNYLNIELAKPS